MGKEIYLSSIKELPCSFLWSWEIGAIIRKGQLTCRHYWWSDTDTSLVLALAFSLSWGSCQELVSQSPCQQGALYELHSQATLWLQRERGIETEQERRGRQPDSPLGARSPDGNTETWLFASSSIQQGSLSVICNKCPQHIIRDLEIITGWGPPRLLIGCVGPYQLRIFGDLWQIPIRKSLFSCQFKRPLKELILILIGTSSCRRSVLQGLKMSSVCGNAFVLTLPQMKLCRSNWLVTSLTGVRMKTALTHI